MTPFKSILVATDFSVDGNHAVRRAALLAKDCGAHLSIVHVVKAAGCKPLRDWFSPSIDVDLKTAQARSTLHRFAAEIVGRHDVAASFEVLVGDPFDELLQASQRGDLIVLGQRGKSRFQAMRIGRTADRLLRTCRRPVLVVKKALEQPYRRVLVPIDFTPSSAAAIRTAAHLAPGIGMHVFHAIDSPREAVLRDADVAEHIIRESRAREDAGVSARMRRSVSRLGLDSRQMSFALGRGPAVRSTLMHAQTLGADLIVAGKQGRSTVAGFLLGSVSSRLLAGSGCDILIVPHPLRAPQSSSAAGLLRPAGQNAVIDTARLGRGAAGPAGALTSAEAPAAATHARQGDQRRHAWAAVARLYP
jgi:nucleotide-binding universal stress UspA family protein